MSGDIEDLTVRLCPACGLVFVEDNQMVLTTGICPRCHASLESSDQGEEA
jgi:Zn-finger nucleic acid-binding protein